MHSKLDSASELINFHCESITVKLRKWKFQIENQAKPAGELSEFINSFDFVSIKMILWWACVFFSSSQMFNCNF